MTTALEHDLKRELHVGSAPYTLTISPDGLKLVPKGKRNGLELSWTDLVSGQAALAVALNASLARIGQFSASEEGKPQAIAAPSPTARRRAAASRTTALVAPTRGNAPNRKRPRH